MRIGERMLPLCISKSEPARGRDLSVESDRGVYANTKLRKKSMKTRYQILNTKRDEDMEEDVDSQRGDPRSIKWFPASGSFLPDDLLHDNKCQSTYHIRSSMNVEVSGAVVPYCVSDRIQMRHVKSDVYEL